MAITVDQQLAICRIYVPGTKTRGTGFLIRDRNQDLCVLTAAHVVRQSTSPTVKYAGQDIELHFGPQRSPVAGASVGSFAFDVDAAILRLPAGALPAGGQPFQLRPFARGYQLGWETFGYSKQSEALGPNGQAYGGTIRTANPNRFQLKVDQSHGNPAGLSGSPVIVDGQVVALVLETADSSTSETVFARCVGGIAAALPELVLEKIPPAYIGEVTFRLRDYNDLLAQTAVALKLGKDRNEVLSTIQNLPERVAEAMLASSDSALIGVKDLRDGLRLRARAGDPSPPEAAARIVEFSLKTWIDAGAVAMLAEALRQGDKLIILNTSEAEVADWYVHRAGCIASNHPGIFEHAFSFDVQSIERDALVDDFAKTLRAKFGDDFVSSLEDEVNHDREPVVVWLNRVPERSDLDHLRKQHPIYQKIRFILLVGGDIPTHVATNFADARIIEPRLVEEEVKRALEARATANSRLMRIFKPKPLDTSP